jgi:tRNA1(Val) A37 N6-methylase TrmN6
MSTAQRAQHVVFNPPYFAEGHGIVSPNLCRALARHAQPDVLSAFLECAVRNLAPSGWISHVMRADQKQQYTQALLEHGLFSRRLREIKTRAHKPTRAVLCEAQNHISHTFLEEAPLIVHRPCHSALTEEVEQWVSGVFKAGLKNASEVKHGRPV